MWTLWGKPDRAFIWTCIEDIMQLKLHCMCDNQWSVCHLLQLDACTCTHKLHVLISQALHWKIHYAQTHSITRNLQYCSYSKSYLLYTPANGHFLDCKSIRIRSRSSFSILTLCLISISISFFLISAFSFSFSSFYLSLFCSFMVVNIIFYLLITCFNVSFIFLSLSW